MEFVALATDSEVAWRVKMEARGLPVERFFWRVAMLSRVSLPPGLAVGEIIAALPLGAQQEGRMVA